MLLSEFRKKGMSALAPLYPEAEAAGILSMLCAHRLGIRSYTHIIEPGYEIMPEDKPLLEEDLRRLASGEPVQYVLGVSEFCGRMFRVNPAVLIPRPETEILCREAVAALSGVPHPAVIDLCTGSGNIAWTVALSVPGASVVGVDLSAEALDVARSQPFGEGPVFLQADILLPPPAELEAERFDLLLSNPPYVMESEKARMRRNVLSYEPASALFVPDTDPLVFYRAVADWAERLLKPGGTFMVEINESLGLTAKALFADRGFCKLKIIRDFYEKDRFVAGEKVGGSQTPLSVGTD